MNDADNKEMTDEELEQDFKDMFASVFTKRVPGSYVDEDGFVVVPVKRRRKSSES